jgi:hypothetical protein
MNKELDTEIVDQNYKIVGRNLATVADLKRVINQLPDDYELSLTGEPLVSVATSDDTKIVLLDNINFMEENYMKEELL